MNRIIGDIEYLRKLTGNEQLEYLNKVKNETLREILEYTYDPNKTYKIDQGKFVKVKVGGGLFAQARKKKQEFTYEDWHNFTQLLDEFAEKRAVTDVDVKRIKLFITDFGNEDVQNFLAMVMYKDLRLNLGIKKIQTVWPDFCKMGQVQLAENYKGINFDIGMYSRKFDGKRMLIEQGVAKSRAGKPCKTEPIHHILQEIQQFSKDCVLDGELLYFDPYGKEDFQKAISLSSSDLRSVDCCNLYYVVFDLLSPQAWQNQQALDDFKTEYQTICSWFEVRMSTKFGYSLFETKYPHILVARQDFDATQLQELRMANNWEGLMYRNANAPYEFKRTRNLLKIKDMQDEEFEIAGVERGTGKNKNRLGKLVIKYNGNFVGVGSGFTDSARDLIWANKTKLLDVPFTDNFNVKVQYFEKTFDAYGNPSLRFPVFVCFRHKQTGEEITVEQAVEWCEDK